MISFFRRFFQSKIGLPIFLGFLALVALAFAASDITGVTFGGIGNSERAALVGDDRIDTAELASTAQAALERARQEDPTLTMEQLIAQGGLDEVLDQLIDRYAIGAYAEGAGLRAGDNLVNSEILQIPAFRGPTGEFDEEIYRAALARQRISEAVLRRDFADGLLAQQMLVPAIGSPQMPRGVARRYASLLLERREGQIAVIPSQAFIGEDEPSAEAVAEYYEENREQYLQPERRSLRFAVFGAQNLNTEVSATPAEIAARYEENTQRYQASETRDVTLFVVPTQAGAEALVRRVRAGEITLAAAAREAGFSTTQITGRTREQLAREQSAAVAQAVFEAQRGAIADPARSSLGFTVARVDAVNQTAARTLAEVRDELAAEITAQKTANALADLSARIEEQVDTGVPLSDIAEAFDLQLETSPQILADGRVFGAADQQTNPLVRPILEPAFALEESEPQLDQLVPGQQFIVYEVADITPAAAPPLAEIREVVSADLRRERASRTARAVADRVLGKVRGGTALSEALAEEEEDLPPVDTVALSREQLLQQTRGNVPPALVLLFSMAQGTTKLLEAPRNQGWILVDLDRIETGEIADDSPLLAQTAQQLSGTLADEYAQQITRAMREEVGVTINQDALDAVRKQLLGDG
ncbi:MAG: SurA N-terminal domain-containing protein [Erythrobacter sp.]|jgi:peptidyl-prolyl cis-trans isomerase D|nr:SurA N-terminal domain-containing protein [Erythrobacter sp.]